MGQAPTDDRIESVLAEARGRLASGRAREADDAFGRVLLHDPGHAEAREGLSRARAAAAEERRRLDAELDEARAALEAGDRERARRLLDEVVRLGGNRDEALALLDRLERSAAPGAIAPAAPGRLSQPLESGPASSPRRGERRRVLVAAWGAVFALLAAGIVSAWDDLVSRLVRTPSPRAASAPPATDYPAPTVGERAVADARSRIERSDPEGALAALAGVRPEDPAYPFATQVRAQAERALAERGPRR